jgi:formate hydrogenlyase subunit 3/multisubunit Na+/H+ antiporter MnhD subunit
MILAAGLGPFRYAFAVMHLVTHGFFKAGLFLGAGSVMHGMNDEVDMRKYGGLRKYMPITFVTFGLGYLAIIGFPGLSGFFSKDKIIEAAFAKGGTEGWILGGAALLGAQPVGVNISASSRSVGSPARLGMSVGHQELLPRGAVVALSDQTTGGLNLSMGRVLVNQQASMMNQP